MRGSETLLAKVWQDHVVEASAGEPDLINCLDEIALPLAKDDRIAGYERLRRPWLPRTRPAAG